MLGGQFEENCLTIFINHRRRRADSHRAAWPVNDIFDEISVPDSAGNSRLPYVATARRIPLALRARPEQARKHWPDGKLHIFLPSAVHISPRPPSNLGGARPEGPAVGGSVHNTGIKIRRTDKVSYECRGWPAIDFSGRTKLADSAC